jgi:hypothetical protein
MDPMALLPSTVTCRFAVCPSTTETDAVVVAAVVVVAGICVTMLKSARLIVSVRTAEVDDVKFMVFAYIAVIECVPTELYVTVHVAIPPDRTPEPDPEPGHRAVLPSINWTLPVTTTSVGSETLAVNVTGLSIYQDAFDEEIIVVVLACPTVKLTVFVATPYCEFPLKLTTREWLPTDKMPNEIVPLPLFNVSGICTGEESNT